MGPPLSEWQEQKIAARRRAAERTIPFFMITPITGGTAAYGIKFKEAVLKAEALEQPR
jgi:hypothetical protein